MSEKPKLVIQDFFGAHNADIGKTRARLIRGGSWRKQGIVLVIPSADLIPAKVVLSWMNLAFPPNNPVVRVLVTGCEVGHGYSEAIEQILAHPELSKFPFLATLEHDNAPAPDAILRLLEALETHPEYAAVSASYFTKGPSGVWQGWGDCSDPVLNFRPQIPRPGEIQEVNGIGMGMAIFRMSIFKDERIKKPWFKTSPGCTQDLAFWQEARKYGYRCAVDVDCKTGHYDFEGKFGPPDTMW